MHLALAALLFVAAADPEPSYDQSGVPLEVDTNDPKLTKIVLVAGRQSHGAGEHEFFAGTAILMKLLQQTPGVFPVMARDGWPKNEAIFKGAKSVVLFMDGRDGHPLVKDGRLELMQRLIDQKAGFVNLHYAVDYKPEHGERIKPWIGGYYDYRISINPHWKGDFKLLPDHPVSRGVKPFAITDEWYYNMNFVEGMKGVTPILRSTPPDGTRRTADTKLHPGREETVAWTYDRTDGGRGFGFTGGHFHRNWGDENFRRLVTNAILWSAMVEVPKDGAGVELEAAELGKNLDRKGAK